MSLPNPCVVDTNVPIIANLALNPDDKSDVSDEDIKICVAAIEKVIKERSLVLDDKNEIFDEYTNKLSMRGRPGLGDVFVKWVHDHRWGLPESSRVSITKDGDSYHQFPRDQEGLKNFDISDRKFVAVANAHPDKPHILQATDCKWWGWDKALKRAGITVHFLCEDYVKAKHGKKMEP